MKLSPIHPQRIIQIINENLCLMQVKSISQALEIARNKISKDYHPRVSVLKMTRTIIHRSRRSTLCAREDRHRFTIGKIWIYYWMKPKLINQSISKNYSNQLKKVNTRNPQALLQEVKVLSIQHLNAMKKVMKNSVFQNWIQLFQMRQQQWLLLSRKQYSKKKLTKVNRRSQLDLRLVNLISRMTNWNKQDRTIEVRYGVDAILKTWSSPTSKFAIWVQRRPHLNTRAKTV